MKGHARMALSICFLLASLAPAGAYEIPEAAYPSLPASAATAEAFVPEGWAIEVEQAGDLNADGRDDLLLVLKGQDPACLMANEPASPGMDEWDANPRILAVAFALASGGYALVLQSDAFLPRHEDPCIDDPFGGAEITDGSIRIFLHYWANAGSWYTASPAFAFRYLDGRFRLVAYSNYMTKRNTGESWDLRLDYLSGKAELRIGDFSSDEAGETAYERELSRDPPAALEDIGPGWECYPEQLDLSWWGIEEE